MTQRSLQPVLVVNSLPEHPHAMLHDVLLNTVHSDPAPRRFNLKATWQSSHGVRGDSKCDSCQHSVMHQVESLIAAAYRFTLVNFITFKCTGLSVSSFLRLENEVIVDSSGIL